MRLFKHHVQMKCVFITVNVGVQELPIFNQLFIGLGHNFFPTFTAFLGDVPTGKIPEKLHNANYVYITKSIINAANNRNQIML